MHGSPDHKADTSAQGADKFSLSHLLWACVAILLFLSAADLDRVFHLYRLLAPVVFIPALAVLVCWIAALMQNAVLKRWRRLTSALAAPFAVYALFAMADAAGVDAARIRLEIGRHYYLDQIAKLEPSDGLRLKLFD